MIIFCITLASVLSVSSISPVLPTVVSFFNVSDYGIPLLIISFTIPGVIFSPVMGMLSDRFGRKKVLVPSLLLFGASGFSCAFASDFSTLLWLRFIQGIGASAIGSLNNTIIGDLYTDDECTTTMGYNAAVLNIGMTMFPLVGGALGTFSWRYPFMLPIVAIPIALLVLFGLDVSNPDAEKNFKKYFNSSIKIFKDKKIIVLISLSFLLFSIFYGVFIAFFPVYMVRTFVLTPIGIGGIMSTMAISTILVSTQLGKISSKVSVNLLLMLGFSAFGISFLMIPVIPSISLMIIPLVIYGIGEGIANPMIQSTLAKSSAKDHRGVVMSTNGMSLRAGQTIGPLLFGEVLSLYGISYVFYIGAVVSIVTTAFVAGSKGLNKIKNE